MGIVLLSDPSGQYEAVIFEESLNMFRDKLNVGQSVILQVSADLRDEGVGLRINHVELLDQVASREERDMTVFVDDAMSVQHLPSVLKGRGNSRVSIVVIQNQGEREIEVQLPDKYDVSSKTMSAIKAVPGVMDVRVA